MLCQEELTKHGLKLKKLGHCDRFLVDKKGYAFMPIEVRVVTEEEYQEWLLDAKLKFAKEIIEEDQFKKLARK